ncbi:MAG: diguanylate cyclase domain-containing protein [Microthrixaceae bacterium]
MNEPTRAELPDQRSAKVDDWDALGVGIVVLDAELDIVRSNHTALELLSDDLRALDGLHLPSLVDPVDAEPIRTCVAATWDSALEQSIRLPSLGRRRDLLMRFRNHRSGEVVVAIEDETEAAASDQLRRAMHSVLDGFGGFIGIADDRANVMYLNHRACEILGVSPQRAETLRLTDMLHAETFNRYYEEIRPTILEHGKWSGIVRLAADDAPEAMWGTVFGGVGTDGETIEWLAAVTDADESSMETVELAYRANHDHLTGLANRSLFLDRLRLALLRRDRVHHPVTVAFVDLNGFKAVNDSAGHQIGDELLRLVAERLSTLMRPTDTVARWGGDEFVVLCEDAGPPEGVAKRLRAGVADEPFDVKGTEYHLGATVGTAASPPGPSGAEELVAAADVAMYRSKRSSAPRLP